MKKVVFADHIAELMRPQNEISDQLRFLNSTDPSEAKQKSKAAAISYTQHTRCDTDPIKCFQ